MQVGKVQPAGGPPVDEPDGPLFGQPGIRCYVSQFFGGRVGNLTTKRRNVAADPRLPKPGIPSYKICMPPTPLEIGPAGNRVARAIERTRTARGVAQRQLAARATALGHPMTVTTISRIERRRRRCDVDDLVAIAAALGVSPLVLLQPAA